MKRGGEKKNIQSLINTLKLPDIQKRVENDCYVYTSQSHQCNSRNIPEYD
jgi:hypothetical protein